MGPIDSIDLNPNHLATVKAILAEHVAECEVRAFGSRATWTAKDYSDLDLAVVGEGPMEWKALGRLKEAFEESDLPMRVDVLDWHAISESFQKVIQQDHIVLWEGTRETTAVNEWREVTLGDLIDIKHGFAFKGVSIHDEPQGDVLLTPGNFAIGGGFKGDRFKYYDGSVPEEFVLDEGDLLVTMTDLSKQSDTLGYPAIVPPSTDGRSYLHNQRLGKILPKGNVDICTRYLYYVMCTTDYRHEVLASATGTTVKHTSPDRLKEFRFVLPPLAEQEAIAHVLGTLDDKIELNRRMNETLEEMARALFKSWFVDFDPVRAKMEGRWHQGESLPGLPANLYDLFPDRLVDSELGEIPEGWEVKTLGELSCKPQYGYTESAKDEPIGPKFLRISDINKEAWIEWKSVPHCEITEEDFEKYRLNQGDILIARMADPGHGCMIEESRYAVFASYLIRFRPKEERYGRLLQYWLRSDAYWGLVWERGAGTTRVTLNAKVLSELPLVVPPKRVLDDFGRQIRGVRDRVVKNVEESKVIATIRDELLPRMLSDKLGHVTLVERG